jgi:hypothetical protein
MIAGKLDHAGNADVSVIIWNLDRRGSSKGRGEDRSHDMTMFRVPFFHFLPYSFHTNSLSKE